MGCTLDSSDADSLEVVVEIYVIMASAVPLRVLEVWEAPETRWVSDVGSMTTVAFRHPDSTGDYWLDDYAPGAFAPWSGVARLMPGSVSKCVSDASSVRVGSAAASFASVAVGPSAKCEIGGDSSPC